MFEFSLHCSGADTRAYDNSDMNPFMIAIDKGHMEVVKAMEQKDPGLVSFSVGSGSTMIHWALEKSHHRSAYFKVYYIVSFAVIPIVSLYSRKFLHGGKFHI